MEENDPFKEFGGSKLATENDPFAEFGGKSIKKKVQSAPSTTGGLPSNGGLSQTNPFGLNQQTIPTIDVATGKVGSVPKNVGTNKEKSTLSDIGNSFAAGLNNLYKGLSKAPRYLYEVAAIPQNLLADAIDNNAGKGTADWLRTNEKSYDDLINSISPNISPLTQLDKLGDYYGAQEASYQDRVTKYDKGIFDSITDGKWGDAGSQVANNISQSIPSMLLMAGTSGVGNVAKLGTTSKTLLNALPFASTKASEIRDDETIPSHIKPVISLGYGLSEVIFDQSFGTQAIISKISDKLLNEGGDAALNAGKEVVKGYFKKALSKVKEPLTDLGKNALEEASTQISQNIIDKITVDPNKDLMDGVVDAALVGGVMGGALGGIGAIISPKVKQSIETKNKQIEDISKDLETDIPAEVKDDLLNKIGDLKSEIRKDIDGADKNFNSLDEKSRVRAAEIGAMIENIDITLNSDLVSETTKVMLEDQKKSLSKELADISTLEKSEPVLENQPEIKPLDEVKLKDDVSYFNQYESVAKEAKNSKEAFDKLTSDGKVLSDRFIKTYNPSGELTPQQTFDKFYDEVNKSETIVSQESLQTTPKKEDVVEAPVQPKTEKVSEKGNGNDLADRKSKQLEIINKTNPAPNDFNTWVRKIEDIKTPEEAFAPANEDGEMYPDFTVEDMSKVLKTGKVTVYSSKPIKDGVFVTPSKMNAEEYGGGKGSKIYSQEVNANDIAWIDEGEGQYAPIPVEDVKEITYETVKKEKSTKTELVETSKKSDRLEEQSKPERTDAEHAKFIKEKFKKVFIDKGVSKNQMNAAIALMEARAKASGRGDEWFRQIEDIKNGEFQSEDVLYQFIPKKIKNTAKIAVAMALIWNMNAKISNKLINYKDDAQTKEVLKQLAKNQFVYFTEKNGINNPKDDGNFMSSGTLKYVTELWAKSGYPKINVKKSSGSSNYNPLTNQINILVNHDMPKYISSDLNDNGEFVYGIDASLILAEMSHALQASKGDITVARAVKEYIDSGFDYKKQYKQKGTLENEAHSHLEKQLVDGFVKSIKFQKENGYAKGALETLNNGKKIIHALESPNFSTAVHEIAHLFEDELSDVEKSQIINWAKTDKWNVDTSETFARGFERYLRDGKSPNNELKSIFEKAKNWLTEIYAYLKGSSIEKSITPEIKSIFDKLLVGENDVKIIESEKLVKAKEKLKVAKDEFSDFIKKSRGQAGVGVELTEFVAKATKLMAAYAEVGIVKLSDVIKELRSDYGDEFVDNNLESLTIAHESLNKSSENPVTNESVVEQELNNFETLINQRLPSKETRETKSNVEQETGDILSQEMKEYENVDFRRSLAHGEAVVEQAKRVFGDNYVTEFLDYVKESKLPFETKAVMIVSLENSLRKELLSDTKNVKLKKQVNLVTQASIAHLRSGATATAVGVFRQAARVGYETELAVDAIFSPKEKAERSAVERAVFSTPEDIQKYYDEKEADIDKAVADGVEKRINEIYESLPSARRQRADKAIAALDRFQKKLRSKTYDASIGVPVAIIDAGISTIKSAIRAGVNIADAIELGIKSIKDAYGKTWEKEADFRKDMLDGFSSEGIAVADDIAQTLKQELIDAGYSKEITVNTKDGKQRKKVYDWKKLLGAEGSFDNLKEALNKSFKNKGYSQDQIDAFENQLKDEYNDIHADIIEKSVNELERRNKPKEANGKILARKLAELYNLGAFEEDSQKYANLLNNILGISPQSQEAFNQIRELNKSLAKLLESKDQNGNLLSDIALATAENQVKDQIKRVIEKVQFAEGSMFYKASVVIKNIFSAMQRMMLVKISQAIENPLSGKLNDIHVALQDAFKKKNWDSPELKKRRKELASAIYADINLNRGDEYGGVGNPFTSKNAIEGFVNSLSKNAMYQVFASALSGRVYLDAADSYFKIKRTEKEFTHNLLRILTDKSNPNGAMSQDEAIKYVSEAITGQNFEDAKDLARSIIKDINTDAGKEVLRDTETNIIRIANDIVKDSLVSGEMLTEQQVEAAFRAGYKTAGKSIGHESNNFLTDIVNAQNRENQQKLNKALKNKDWTTAASLNLTSVLLRNIISPFVGGGTNWLVIGLQKMGVPTELIRSDVGPTTRPIDLSTKQGLKELKDTLSANADRQRMYGRMVTGVLTAVVALLAVRASGDEDEYKKWLKKHPEARKLINKIIPTWLALYLAKDDNYEFVNAVMEVLGARRNYDTEKITKASKDFYKGIANEDEEAMRKAWGAMGEVVGRKTSVPYLSSVSNYGMVERKIRKEFTTGQKEKFKASKGFWRGYFKGGLLDYLGLIPAEKPLSRAEIEAKRTKNRLDRQKRSR